jgi:hypothetical protein
VVLPQRYALDWRKLADITPYLQLPFPQQADRGNTRREVL